MDSRDITPLILTYDEEANIARALESLRWADSIVVIDSGSSDGTKRILAEAAKVRLFDRKFDSHSDQWNFGLRETNIDTEWVLALDADYVVSRAFLDELEALRVATRISGFEVSFIYRVFGRPLRGTLYPPKVVLFRKSCAEFFQDGHTQRIRINGQVERLREPIYHDDRKPLGRWFASQARYAKLESKKLLEAQGDQLSTLGRLRRTIVLSPPAVLFYCLFIKGCIFDGWPGWYYSLQRMAAETSISLAILDGRLRSSAKGQGERS